MGLKQKLIAFHLRQKAAIAPYNLKENIGLKQKLIIVHDFLEEKKKLS